jgi:hypothetical protein
MHVFARRGIAGPAAKVLAVTGAVSAILLGMMVTAVPASAGGYPPRYYVRTILSASWRAGYRSPTE